MTTPNILVHKRGRRYYLVGDTYSIRADIKAAGFKWDSANRAWWTADAMKSEQFLIDLRRGDVTPELPSPTYARLPDDSWGVRVPAEIGGNAEDLAAIRGTTITVRTRAGGTKQETIGEVVSSDERGTLVRVERAQRSPGGRRETFEDREVRRPRRRSVRSYGAPIEAPAAEGILAPVASARPNAELLERLTRPVEIRFADESDSTELARRAS